MKSIIKLVTVFCLFSCQNAINSTEEQKMDEKGVPVVKSQDTGKTIEITASEVDSLPEINEKNYTKIYAVNLLKGQAAKIRHDLKPEIVVYLEENKIVVVKDKKTIAAFDF